MVLRWLLSHGLRSSRLPGSRLRPTFARLLPLLAALSFVPCAAADSLVVTPIAEGVTLKTYKYESLYGARMEVFILVADLDHPAVGVKFNFRRGSANGDPYRPVPVLAAEVPNAVAAVNAQFFDLAGGTGSVQYQKVDGVLINGSRSGVENQGVIVRADGRAEVVWRPETGWESLTDVPNILVSNDDLITNGAIRNNFSTTSTHYTSRHPRTAAAWTYDNKLILAVVDGRSTKSAGMTMREWANYIATLGDIRNAFNYDGGGSSTTWANGTVWNTPSDGTPRSVANAVVLTSRPLPSDDIIVDNPQASVTGAWTTGTSSADRYGPDYRFKSQGDGSANLTFTPTIPKTGTYEVFAMYPRGANRTTAAPYIITHAGGQTTVNVNQQVNGGVWNSLGTYTFSTGSGGSVRITDGFPEADKVVIADAIRWAKPAPAATTTIVSASPNPSVVGQPETFVATVNASSGPLTGTVTFFDGVTELDTVDLDSNSRRAMLTTASLSVGTHSIEAVYNGSATHAPSASVPFLKTISQTGLCIPAPPGLMAWWPADGHTQDLASANTGAFAMPFTTGYRGQAFQFDGSAAQKATVPNTPSLHVNAHGSGITLAAWIRPDDTGNRPIAEYGTPADGGNARGTWLWVVSGGGLEANLRTTSGMNHYLESEPGTILAGTWQHVAMTYDKASGWMRLYRNGFVILEQRLSANISFRTQYPLGIGHRPNGTTRFKGLMDELMLFDRAVAPEEMLALYNTGIGGACRWTNLVPSASSMAWSYKPSGAAVVSTPTVYNQRAYLVDNAGALRALDTRTGAVDTVFGTHILDTPVLGRPTVSFAGGQGRLYLLTRAATLYVKDLATGADIMEPVRLLGTGDAGQPNPAESSSSPAVSYSDQGLYAFAGVDDPVAGIGFIARVDLATREVTTMRIGTTVTSSPSVTQDGTTVQIGAVDGAGGRLLSLQTNDFTARLALETEGSQFHAPPVVSVVDGAPTLMVGDSGGTFYSYNASNGTLRWLSGQGGVPALDGGIDQSAWVDYAARPNIVYVGTGTGRVYALDAATGAPAATLPMPTGGAVTGGPLVLSGGASPVLYLPTVNGLFAARPDSSTLARFAAAPGSTTFYGFRSPSATSATRGSIIVVTAGNGTVYGLVAQ